LKSDLIKAMKEALLVLNAYPSKIIKLFHHNDTDGLTSGTILLNCFEQSGYEVSRYSLEKPYPKVLEMIFKESGQIIVFTDFAGKIAPMIAQLNAGRNLVLIIDHHPAEESPDKSVINLDGDLFGLKGDRDISASATCYLFSEVLLNSIGKASVYLSHLGTLGAIGDGFLVDGALSGVNRELLIIAEENKLIRIVRTETEEKYFITIAGVEYSASEVCTSLDTLGGVGYYQDGTDLGVQLCLKGITPELKKIVAKLNKTKNEIFTNEIKWLKENITRTSYLNWFNVEDRFRPMGVKMIGVFCSQLKNMSFVENHKYIAGFQTIPDEVPGFGPIDFKSTKISMRVSDSLTKKIRNGTSPGLDDFLMTATDNIGGFADACHSLSAATTVRLGQEKSLINEIENVLRELGNINNPD